MQTYELLWDIDPERPEDGDWIGTTDDLGEALRTTIDYLIMKGHGMGVVVDRTSDEAAYDVGAQSQLESWGIGSHMMRTFADGLLLVSYRDAQQVQLEESTVIEVLSSYTVRQSKGNGSSNAGDLKSHATEDPAEQDKHPDPAQAKELADWRREVIAQSDDPVAAFLDATRELTAAMSRHGEGLAELSDAEDARLYGCWTLFTLLLPGIEAVLSEEGVVLDSTSGVAANLSTYKIHYVIGVFGSLFDEPVDRVMRMLDMAQSLRPDLDIEAVRSTFR